MTVSTNGNTMEYTLIFYYVDSLTEPFLIHVDPGALLWRYSLLSPTWLMNGLLRCVPIHDSAYILLETEFSTEISCHYWKIYIVDEIKLCRKEKSKKEKAENTQPYFLTCPPKPNYSGPI